MRALFSSKRNGEQPCSFETCLGFYTNNYSSWIWSISTPYMLKILFSAVYTLPLLICHFGTAYTYTRALRGCHSVSVPSAVPGAGPVPGIQSSQGSICGQLKPSSCALTGLPGTGRAGGPDVVPWQNEPPRRWKTAERRRGLPGS